MQILIYIFKITKILRLEIKLIEINKNFLSLSNQKIYYYLTFLLIRIVFKLNLRY